MDTLSAKADVETSWGALTTAVDGTILAVNARLAAWVGRSEAALLGGVRWKELLAPASLILHETHFVPVLETHGVANEVTFDLIQPQGSRFPVLVSACRQGRSGDADARTTITVFDARETRRHERALREARLEAEAFADALLIANRELHAQHQHLQLTLHSIADAVVTTDAQGRVTTMNPTAERLAGLKLADVAGSTLEALGRLFGAESGELIAIQDLLRVRPTSFAWSARLRRQDGGEREVDGSVATIRDEQERVAGSVIVCRDVTAARESARQLAFDASHDHLTQLLNRREFERRLALAAKRERDGDSPDLLLYLDLDQFKIINDTAGHAAGDQALVKVAALLRDSLRQSDVLARLGGDEFGVLLHQCPIECGERIAEALRLRLEEFCFTRGGQVYGLTASVGLSVITASSSHHEALATADLACMAAKESGRNRIHRFDAADQVLRHRRDEMDWVSRIRRGFEEDRFALYFQPIARVRHVAPIGVADDGERHGELLLRLLDDNGRVLPPGTVIAAAERYQQMGRIDRWVVRRAFAWLASVDGVHVSINVSGQSFGDAAFLRFVLDELALHRVAPSRICFEITETAAIANLASGLRFIEALRARGIRFALDDFGAGLSSFTYLKTLPVDCVKIDGSFVKTLCDDPVNHEIVQAIQRVAHRCGLETVAEWVEDAATLEALSRIGVDWAQGWHLGKPEPIVDGRTVGSVATLRS